MKLLHNFKGFCFNIPQNPSRVLRGRVGGELEELPTDCDNKCVVQTEYDNGEGGDK